MQWPLAASPRVVQEPSPRPPGGQRPNAQSNIVLRATPTPARALPTSGRSTDGSQVIVALTAARTSALRQRAEQAADPPLHFRLAKHFPRGTVADHPEVARQWHPVKNGAFTPQLFGSGSAYRMWWQCPGCACGAKHEWRARIVDRVAKQSQCPICRGSRPCVCNSLAALHPHLLDMWDWPGNRPLTPEALLPSSCRKVWWVCDRHPKRVHWEAKVITVVQGTGCPQCREKTRESLPTLESAKPHLAAQWDFERNPPTLSPSTVTLGSNRVVWWKCHGCPCGAPHSWKARIADLALSQAAGCPVCSGRAPCQCNSLAAVQPELVARQWDFEANAVSPADMLPRSHKKIWWKCDLHGERIRWQVTLDHRIRSNVGCSECRRLRMGAYSPTSNVGLFPLQSIQNIC